MTPISQGIIRFCVTFQLRILKVSIRPSASRRASGRFANRVLLNSGRRHAPICPTADIYAAGLSSTERRIYQLAADHFRYFLAARRRSLAPLCHWRWSGACSGQPSPIRGSEVSFETDGRRTAEHKTVKAGVRNPGSGTTVLMRRTAPCESRFTGG